MKNLIWVVVLGGCGCQHDTGQAPESADSVIEPSAVMMAPATETKEGIIVFVHSGEPKYSAETLDTWWIDVQQCLQMTAAPPVIRYADDTREVCSTASGAVGNMCNNGDGLGWFITINSSWAHVSYETKHEMIHYARQLNGYSDHANHDFENDTFWQCRYN